MYKSRNNLAQFIKNSNALALVEITSVQGSTPRNEDAWMLVGKDQIFRTVGGGQLEKIAIKKARHLIDTDDNSTHEIQIPLGPDIGQCCGGTVSLNVSLLDSKSSDSLLKRHKAVFEQHPHVYIFGAGHVGKALAEAISLLPMTPILIDSREDELLSAPKDVETRLTSIPEAEVSKAKAGSAYIILTHEHSLDFLIAREVLTRDDAAYVGMIGSKTKRATFRNWLCREDGNEADMEKLICPIGSASIKDKRPEVIAALVVAEIVEHLYKADSV